MVKKISTILKDADALDRARFVSGSNLNSKFLKTETAKNKKIIELANKINNEFAKEIINFNFPEVRNESQNKIKLLHDIRKNNKTKKEIDLPLNIVKDIFKRISIKENYNQFSFFIKINVEI